MKNIRLGIVGAAGRPTAFLQAIIASGHASLVAACDLSREAMDKSLEGLDGIEKYTDYEEMLDKAGLDAVIIGTPLPLHVDQSVAALERNISVYEEIPCGETREELVRLRRAVKNSKAMFMAGENVIFSKQYMEATEMVKDGLFGEVLYAEGEYLHDCRFLLEKTPWRKSSLFETSGLNYGTHSLGPILRWFPDDRIVSLSCVGCGRPDSLALAGDNTTVMMCRTAKGRLIKIAVDISSPRPYRLSLTLQGDKGALRAGHVKGTASDTEVVFACEKKWRPISDFDNKYLPKLWQNAENSESGHGGADGAAMSAFIEALYNGEPSPCDVDEGIRMTLPGIISRESIAKNGEWVKVDDPEDWD